MEVNEKDQVKSRRDAFEKRVDENLNEETNIGIHKSHLTVKEVKGNNKLAKEIRKKNLKVFETNKINKLGVCS